MFDFEFKNIQFVNHLETKTGVYLWILHADKIPPHIGISIDGQYFSLKAKGKDENISDKSIFQVIDKKQIKSVVLKLNIKSNLELFTSEFSCFQRAIGVESSCLVPVRKILKAPETILKLSDLLRYLETEQQIEAVFGLYLNNEYKGIRFYTTNDIQQRIEALNYVERKNDLPKSS
jgi:hypothetical protein